MLVGNKSDAREEGKGVSKMEVRQYLTRKQGWDYMECSAKNNLNVQPIFQRIAKKIAQAERSQLRQTPTSRMKMHPERIRKNARESGCC